MAALLALIGLDCSDADGGPVLVVKTAAQQPIRDDLGVIVLIQSRGGAWLELEVGGGTLSNGRSQACLPAPQAEPFSQTIATEIVYPIQVESVITVRLFADPGERSAMSDAGARAETGACGIEGEPLREVTKPIARLVTALGGSGGSSGAGGSGTGGAGGGGGAVNGGAAGAAGAEPDTSDAGPDASDAGDAP